MKSNSRTGTNKRIGWNIIKEKITVQVLISIHTGSHIGSSSIGLKTFQVKLWYHISEKTRFYIPRFNLARILEYFI